MTIIYACVLLYLEQQGAAEAGRKGRQLHAAHTTRVTVSMHEKEAGELCIGPQKESC
jgi:hypothetical protein